MQRRSKRTRSRTTNFRGRLKDIFGTEYVRHDAIGDGSCFFHAILATDHPNVPLEFRQIDEVPYSLLSPPDKEWLAQSFRSFLQKETKQVLEQVMDWEKEDPETVLDTLWFTNVPWFQKYREISSGSARDMVNFLASDVGNCKKHVGHEASALMKAMYDIPIVFAIVHGIEADTIDCTGAIAVENTDQVVLLAFVNGNHWEPIFRVDRDRNVQQTFFRGDSDIIQKIKTTCVEILAPAEQMWFCIDGKCVAQDEKPDIDEPGVLKERGGDPKIFFSKSQCQIECRKYAKETKSSRKKTKKAEESLIVDRDGCQLRQSDLDRIVKPDGWINDEAIQCYFRLLQERFPNQYFASTYLLEKIMIQGYEKVRSWVKIDIAKIHTIFIPVHVDGKHWALIVVDRVNSSIQYFDSFGSIEPPQAVKNAIFDFLIGESEKCGWCIDMEWTWEDEPGLKKIQTDGSSCGIFMLITAKRLASFESVEDLSQSQCMNYRKIIADEIINGKLY